MLFRFFLITFIYLAVGVSAFRNKPKAKNDRVLAPYAETTVYPSQTDGYASLSGLLVKVPTGDFKAEAQRACKDCVSFPKGGHHSNGGNQYGAGRPMPAPAIPIEMMKLFSTMTSLEQLANTFKMEYVDDIAPKMSGSRHSSVSKFSFKDFEENELQVSVKTLAALPDTGSQPVHAQPAQCEPQLSVVAFQKDQDPSILFFPSCTRIEQCSGCCNHDMLQCLPTKVEPIHYRVAKLKVSTSTSLQVLGTEEKILEKHIGCLCQCRVQAKHCNAAQVYLESHCRCACVNEHRAALCSAQTMWDGEQCRCKCRQLTECSTGNFFNDSTCLCEPLPDDPNVGRLAMGGDLYPVQMENSDETAKPNYLFVLARPKRTRILENL